MAVIVDLGEADEMPDYVVLRPLLLRAVHRSGELALDISPQVADQQSIAAWSLADLVKIGEIEVLEPEVHFTAWEDNDLRNFDGVFGNRAGYLGHQLLDILLWQNAIQLPLRRHGGFPIIVRNLLLHLGLPQVAQAIQLPLVFVADQRHHRVLRRSDFRLRRFVALLTGEEVVKLSRTFVRLLHIGRRDLDDLALARLNVSTLADRQRLHGDDRAVLLRLLNDLVEAVMRDDGQRIDHVVASAPAIGKPQAAAQGLLGQNIRVRGTQRHDGEEVGDIPALLQLVHVDDDVGLVLVLQFHEALHGLVRFLRTLVRMHFRYAAAISTAEEGIALNVGLQFPCVGGVLRDNQHERMDQRMARFAGVEFEVYAHLLMIGHAVFQHDPL